MQSTTIDQVKPGPKWAFTNEVAECFTNMLERSVPDYRTMRQLVFDIGSQFVQPDTDIVDIGCSRGDGLQPFIDRFGSANRFVGLDESVPMLCVCHKRFKSLSKVGITDIRMHDLREGLPMLFPSLVLSVLTLQFVPVECRQKVIADAYRTLWPGGALILVEKVLGDDAAADRLLVDRYYALKKSNGYTQTDIDDKRRSLQGVLVPLTADANEQLLRAEGFRVQRFWQALNFVGWVAVKPEKTR